MTPRLPLLLLGLIGCSSPPPEPRSDHGTLLFADNAVWAVQHDDPLSRTVQGVEIYAAPTQSAAAGSHVDLWIDRDDTHWGQITRFEITGTDPLPPNHINGGSALTGIVVRAEATKLLIDHEPIPEVMPGMVMPFVASRADTAGLLPGDRVTGRIVASNYGYVITGIQTIGSVDVSGAPQGTPLELGDALPAFTLDGHNGQPVLIGTGQSHPTVLAFVYTTCPDPQFCPATVAKLQAIQAAMPGSARIVAITIDPATDTVPALAAYAELAGAVAPQWLFARPTPAQLHTLAVAAGLTVSHRSGRIAHSTRVLVLNATGALVARFDDNDFRTEDVTQHL